MNGQEALYNSLFTRAIIDGELETPIISSILYVTYYGGHSLKKLMTPLGKLGASNGTPHLRVSASK